MTLPSKLTKALQTVRTVGAITGAGISAESGIQTYRGQGGLYDDPNEGDRTVDALTGSTLKTNPDRTWRTVAALINRSRDARPNAAHHALVRIERSVERFVLLTQNVDGLHRRAGSENIIDIHGDVSRSRCMKCSRHVATPDLSELQGSPLCPTCGGVLRPDVVLFEEMLPAAKLRRIRSELLDNPPDLLLVIGTTAMFPYIAQPVWSRGKSTLAVEVNPERSSVSSCVDFQIEAQAGQAVPLIADVLTTRGL